MKIELSKVLGERIMLARKRLKWTQQALADKTGFGSHQIISQIEKGQRELKAWELSELARVLSVEMSDLMGIKETHTSAHVLWRRKPSSEENLAQKESEFLRRCEQYHRVEQLCGIPAREDLPQYTFKPDRISYRDAERTAETVAKLMDLCARPADTLEKTLEERYGVKIWYMPLQEGSAASTRGQFGSAILMNSKEAPWRRNSNFAHELFHLVTWEAIPPDLLASNAELWNRIEKLAQAFAAHLLLPAQELLTEFNSRLEDGAVRQIDIIEIAREFDVSTEMLLYRLGRLGRLSEFTVQSLLNDPGFRADDRKTMPARWWEAPEIPPRFVRLAFAAYQKGNLSRAKLAEYLDASMVDLREELLKYGFDDSEIYDAPIKADSGNS
jgi:Zn-dependent peptidase ImmA (M78 family)/DNA-binding XRE family transcriptional regulator